MELRSRFVSQPWLRRSLLAMKRHSSSLRISGRDCSLPFEEETLPWYSPDQFYPAHVGETVQSRYKILGKLGYGANSTVWLCRDLRAANFVAVKICTRCVGGSASTDRELAFYEHVSSLKLQHQGQAFIRGLSDIFEIKSSTGVHRCFVHPPMHMTIQELQYQNRSRRLTEQLLKWTLFNLFNALSFLHEEAKVVHTDINPRNIMLTIDDESILERFEQAEREDPSPTKIVDGGRIIYGSRKLGLPKDALWGQPVLCDFGEARIGESHQGLIQPELYRAPEVLFNMGWDSSVDIWSAATLIWDLFENRHLFNAVDEKGESSATHHVAEMVAYMGVPSLEYVQRSQITEKVFDEEGKWKAPAGVAVPQQSLESSLSALEGAPKAQFLKFFRSMLEWLPEKRKTASELLKDPWMTGPVAEG